MKSCRAVSNVFDTFSLILKTKLKLDSYHQKKTILHVSIKTL